MGNFVLLDWIRICLIAILVYLAVPLIVQVSDPIPAGPLIRLLRTSVLPTLRLAAGIVLSDTTAVALPTDTVRAADDAAVVLVAEISTEIVIVPGFVTTTLWRSDATYAEAVPPITERFAVAPVALGAPRSASVIVVAAPVADNVPICAFAFGTQLNEAAPPLSTNERVTAVPALADAVASVDTDTEIVPGAVTDNVEPETVAVAEPGVDTSIA